MKYNNPLMAFVTAAMLLAAPAFVAAAQSSITTELRFAVSQNDELTVTIYGGAADVTTTGGATHTDNIIFTSDDGTTALINATRVGGETQDASNAIISWENTGNANLNVSMGINQTVETQVGACWQLNYSLSAYAENGPPLNTTVIAVDASVAPTDTGSIWLLATATACADSADGEVVLNITATTL